MTPTLPTTHPLNGYHSRAPDDVWIVGVGGTVVRFDGNQLSLLPRVGDMDLHSVFALGPSDVWVGGDDGTLAHWDGTVWREEPLESRYETVHGIWGNGTDTLWAATSAGRIYRHKGPAQ